jgi:hypothetical protein
MSNRRKPRTHRRPTVRAGMPGLDELQEHLAVMLAADAAEARGDASAALDVMARASIGPDGKPFWRPWRERRLLQLVHLDGVLPRWATSRWILSQALQTLDESNRNRSRRALHTATDLRGGPSAIAGVDDVDARCKVADHDWAYRQLFLHDLGGLRHFLGRTASADLVAGADSIHAWAGARMGGYRLLSTTSTTITWEDLANGQQVEVVNLGAAVLLEPDESVVGRIVPIEDGAMFESTPLPVPEAVARDVAGSPDGWVDALRRGGEQARPLLSSVLPEHDLLTDVRESIWRGYLGDLGFAVGDPVDEPCEVVPDALTLVRVALAAKAEPPDWLLPCVAAALVVPLVPDSLLEYADSDELAALGELATRLPGPAAAICRGITASGRQAS